MNGTQNNAPHEGGQLPIEQCYVALFLFYFQTLKITNMSTLNEKIKIIADNLCAPKNEILENVTLNLVNEYLQNAAFKGYELCQKEYEEKLRWIPVEEILPPKNKKVLVKYHNDNLFSTTEFESKDIIKTCNYCGITHWRFIL